MKTAIVTDTNSGITAQMAREMGIYLIPMPFFIDGSTYYEGETCTPDFFFRHLKAKAEVSTSQPSPEVITSLWASRVWALRMDWARVTEMRWSSTTNSRPSNSCARALAVSQEPLSPAVIGKCRTASWVSRRLAHRDVMTSGEGEGRDVFGRQPPGL